MQTIKTSETGWKLKLDEILDRKRATSPDVDIVVREIIEKVRDEGDKALFDLTRRFDGFDPEKNGIAFTSKEIGKATSKIDKGLYDALKTAAERIEAFHSRQLENSWITTDDTGSILGQKVTPITSVGVYTPGGRNAFPSTFLMNVIPAQIAGVKNIVVVSPTPKGRVNDALLAAAHIAGIEKIYRIGGAQAIAALAFGTESIPKVDKVVGPGNVYVAHAKSILQGIIGIEAVAGPSEIVIIADSGADPRWVAIDLLAQAEHDTAASSMLITPDKKLASKVMDLLDSEMEPLPRKAVAKEALSRHGACILTLDINEAIDIANLIAPEHLELMVGNPFELLGRVENAGAVFLGYHSMESIGDYIAGPNHTLPTSSTARFYSPLGVYDFVKRTSIVGMSEKAVFELGPKAACIARAEDLEAHARAVDYRKR
jgi:histidinol dehydrogenase